MDATEQMVSALKQGEAIRLVLARGESMSTAHATLNRIEREHNLTIGRVAKVTGREVIFYCWVDGLGQNPLAANRRVGS